MNPVIETLLCDLIAESRANGPAAVYSVLHQLYGCVKAGKGNEFAKHCCTFSPVQPVIETEVKQCADNQSQPPC